MEASSRNLSPVTRSSRLLWNAYENRQLFRVATITERLALCSIAEQELTPPERLARLKEVVRHIGEAWVHVLRRLACLQSMGRSEELRGLLHETFAAHIHNELQDVLLLDLIREIGALVLDRDSRSGSVAAVSKDLRDPLVLEELKKDYLVAIPTNVYNANELDPALTAVALEMVEAADLERNLTEFACLRARLPEATRVRRGATARLLATARNKAVAHYDVVRDGADWRMWRVGPLGLTYGQLDVYIDQCTSVIELLLLFVLRHSRSFTEQGEVSQRYVDEYLQALVIGLRQQRREDEVRRAEMARRFD